MRILSLTKTTQIFILAASLIAGTLSAQQDTTKKEFKPSGKVWGYAFGDYYYKMHADSANRGSNQYSNMPETSNAFEFRRVYLGYDYNISERFSTEVLLSYEGNTLSDNSRTVFIKAANLRWKNIYKGADILFGQQATPAFPMTAEKIWGYRSIEKTILDMRKSASSNDLGIGIQAKIGESGNFGYNLLVGNGTAQKLETNIFKKFYGDFYAKLLDKKLVFDVYADFERTNMQPNFHKYKANYKLDVMYDTKPFTIGVEAFVQNQFNYVGYIDTTITPFATDTTSGMVMGISVFTHGSIIKDKLAFFARYDMYNPNTGYNKDYIYTMGDAPVTEMFLTAGVDYTPHKNVHIMPNIWYNSYTSRAKDATGKVKSDFDMVPRLTVWYIFK
ncbi:hypothetical protein BH09BAC5_BH09BAC5_21260 [soil metagenome]